MRSRLRLIGAGAHLPAPPVSAPVRPSPWTLSNPSPNPTHAQAGAITDGSRDVMVGLLQALAPVVQQEEADAGAAAPPAGGSHEGGAAVAAAEEG